MSARLDVGLDREDLRLDAQEDLILDVTETILEVMDDCGVSRADLARELGVTRAHISQVLSGERNMTLRTLSDLAFALGRRATVYIRPTDSAVLREAPPVNVIPLPHAANWAAPSHPGLRDAREHGTWLENRLRAAHVAARATNRYFAAG